MKPGDKVELLCELYLIGGGPTLPDTGTVLSVISGNYVSPSTGKITRTDSAFVEFEGYSDPIAIPQSSLKVIE